jgi:hypothetical protein
MADEGWYVDPYGVHEARWISDGRPTALVRDGTVEAQDPPPDTSYPGHLEELGEDASPDGRDLLRSDDAEGGPADARPPGEGAWDVFGETGGGD